MPFPNMFVRCVTPLSLLLILAFTNIEGSCMLGYETCLMKHLKSNMETEDVDVRPALNQSETTHVQFGIAMTYIESLEQIGNNDYEMTVSCWFRHSWVDHRLAWDPTEFGNIREIRMPIQYIWKPDLVLYNNRKLNDQMNTDALAVVTSDGAVLWIPMGKMTTQVHREHGSWLEDVSYYATYKFGSWTYDGFKLDVDFFNDFPGIALDDYVSHPNLRVMEQSGKKNVKYYPCCVEPYPDLTFTMKLKEM